MIRVAALLCLVALPATAQDFRGLLPGMPPSALAALGEPLAFFPFGADDPLTEAEYPLPFGQRLQVYFTAERITSLTTWGDPVELMLGNALASGGLQTFTSTLGDAIGFAGSEGTFFEARGQFQTDGDQRTWWLVYDLPPHPGIVLELQFLELNAVEDVTFVDGFATLPLHVPLAQAALYHPDHLREFADIYGDTRTSRPGAAPFETALPQVFPFTQLP